MPDPFVPEDVTFSQLDREVRGRLRTLSKDNAERAGRHLVMVGKLLDVDPEAAYEHAQAAVRRAGRVDVVREAAGIAAYRTGRFAEALRELRTVRRLNGSSEHLALMADCERGLGRPERAIALAQEPEAKTLARDAQIELAMVVSGARLDLGQPEAAVAVLTGSTVAGTRGLVAARVAQARAAALKAAGRPEDAAAELAAFPQDVLDEAAGVTPEPDEDVVVYDLADDDAAAGTADDWSGAGDGAADDGDADTADAPAAADVLRPVDSETAADGATQDDRATEDDVVDGTAAPDDGGNDGTDEGAR